MVSGLGFYLSFLFTPNSTLKIPLAFQEYISLPVCSGFLITSPAGGRLEPAALWGLHQAPAQGIYPSEEAGSPPAYYPPRLSHWGSYANATFHSSFIILFIFGCAGSSWLHKLFSGCGEWGLLSRCSMQAPHCGGLSFQTAGSRACGSQQLWPRALGTCVSCLAGRPFPTEPE